MKNFEWLAILTLCLAFALALAMGCENEAPDNNKTANSDSDSDGDTDTDSDADADTDSDADTDTDSDSDGDRDPPPGCADLVDGWNTGYPVGAQSYDLYLHLPTGAEKSSDGNWAVVFNWHSLGTSAHDFDSFISETYDNDLMPFIGVTVNSNGHMMMGFDMTWDVYQVNPEKNNDIELFDSLLECFDKRFGIDEDHIHSMGFSLGGILTDMLATTRGDVLASVATYSGGYLGNPDNVATLGMLSGMVKWPEPTHENAYPQLLCHSGKNDTFNLVAVVIHFDQFGTNDVPYLNGMGHDVIYCVNETGSQHGDLRGLPSPMSFVEFFHSHPMGTHDSPWSAGLPEMGFELCSFSGKD